MEIIISLCFIVLSLVLIKRFYSKRLIVSTVLIYILAIIYLALISREPAPNFQYSIKLFRAARRGIEFGGGVLHGLLTGKIAIKDPIILKGVILNILLFVPFGYLMPLLCTRANRSWKVMLYGLLFSLIIELLQFFTRLGFADVDDLINNTLGAGLGWLLYKTIFRKEGGAS